MKFCVYLKCHFVCRTVPRFSLQLKTFLFRSNFGEHWVNLAHFGLDVFMMLTCVQCPAKSLQSSITPISIFVIVIIIIIIIIIIMVYTTGWLWVLAVPVCFTFSLWLSVCGFTEVVFSAPPPSQEVGSAWVSLSLVGCRCTGKGVFQRNTQC